jgi:Ca-activated chloride channel homolog
MPRSFSSFYISLILFSCLSRVPGQDAGESRKDSTLKLPVDEVVLTFHASDSEGKPVSDIKAGKVRLWDNGVPPHRIVSFGALLDRSLRVGILIDDSESMADTLRLNKTIAERFIQSAFRPESDQAFVGDFGVTSETLRPWSNAPPLIRQSIHSVRIGSGNALRGTALFDAVFRSCFYDFGRADPTETGNILLLFSDGVDNAGQTNLHEALRACQASNTSIYAFSIPPNPGEASLGPKNLRDLTSGSGGRLFRADDGERGLLADLSTIESESRNQYRLVYKPANFKRDGSFHEIEIQPPDRVKRIEVRTGYYAPVQ